MAVNASCSARKQLRSATTFLAFSFTAPVSRTWNWAFCCLSNQSLARANETHNSTAGLSDASHGLFLMAIHCSLYCCNRLWTVTHSGQGSCKHLILRCGGRGGSPRQINSREIGSSYLQPTNTFLSVLLLFQSLPFSVCLYLSMCLKQDHWLVPHKCSYLYVPGYTAEQHRMRR